MNSLKDIVIKVAKEVYQTLGSGYDEGIYHNAFKVEMRLRGINYETEKPVLVKYKGHIIGTLFADIYVWNDNEKVLIEFKAGSGSFIPKYQKAPNSLKEIAQVIHYFKQLELPKGTKVLLINFPFPEPNTGEPDIIEVN